MTQQQELLSELRKGKVNSYQATYAMRIKQAPTRIKELKELGYDINSVTKSDRSVDWYLNSEPQKPKKPEFYFYGNVAYTKIEPVQLEI